MPRFKVGHKKLGGRKKGVPNKFPGDLKQAVLEAAAQVGFDGHGCGGLIGFLRQVWAKQPKLFLKLVSRTLILQQRSTGPSFKNSFSLTRLDDSELLAFRQIVVKACDPSDKDVFLQLIDELRELRGGKIAELQKGPTSN